MELVIATILCLSILNIIPWIVLALRRPDEEIREQLTESDQALAQLIQIIMNKMDSLENMAEDFGRSGQNLDFGTILGQIIQSKMNPTANDDYSRRDDGTFDGTPQIIETTPKNDYES